MGLKDLKAKTSKIQLTFEAEVMAEARAVVAREEGMGTVVRVE